MAVAAAAIALRVRNFSAAAAAEEAAWWSEYGDDGGGGLRRVFAALPSLSDLLSVMCDGPLLVLTLLLLAGLAAGGVHLHRRRRDLRSRYGPMAQERDEPSPPPDDLYGSSQPHQHEKWWSAPLRRAPEARGRR